MHGGYLLLHVWILGQRHSGQSRGSRITLTWACCRILAGRIRAYPGKTPETLTLTQPSVSEELDPYFKDFYEGEMQLRSLP